MTKKTDYYAIWDTTKKNLSKVKTSTVVSCICCKTTFPARQVVETVWNDSQTVMCPHCYVDAILPGEIPEQELSDIFNNLFTLPNIEPIAEKPTALRPEPILEEDLQKRLIGKEVVDYSYGQADRDAWKNTPGYVVPKSKKTIWDG